MWNTEFSLYPYQRRAAGEMVEGNVLLAYEMGLGKTPTTLWAIERMRGSGDVSGTGTVVAPASLKWQWAAEIAKFSDQEALVIDGSAKQRQALYLDASVRKPGYLVMSYDTFVRDWAYHRHIGRAFLVADEATALKTWDSKRTKHFKRCRNLYPVRLALTGTPVENGKAEEIFSILEWVDPGILGKFWDFEKRYVRRNSMGWIEGYRNLDEFHSKIKPVVLRATHRQPEVAKYLPEVQYLDPVMVRMDRPTSRAVSSIMKSLLADLDTLVATMTDPTSLFDPDHPDGRVMAKVQIMRMLLDHPDAVRESARRFDDPDDVRGSAFASEIVHGGLLDRIRSTPKMDSLEQYVKDHLDLDPKNKVVVFCSFVQVARKIADRFPGSVTFTGSDDPRHRDEARRRFSTDPSCRVFVSTDAGGYGLDLPVANLLVNFDLPWQAGLLAQRNARIRRASSTWPFVVVRDFLVEDTIEVRMRQMLDHKTSVADAIVDGQGITEAGTIASDLTSLRAFLGHLTEMELTNA